MSADKKSWKIFWDLQCPFSKKSWEKLASIQAKFGDDYSFTIHLTSLAFHPQAFTAQCAANWIAGKKGGEKSKRIFIDACFEQQEKYMPKKKSPHDMPTASTIPYSLGTPGDKVRLQ